MKQILLDGGKLEHLQGVCLDTEWCRLYYLAQQMPLGDGFEGSIPSETLDRYTNTYWYGSSATLPCQCWDQGAGVQVIVPVTPPTPVSWPLKSCHAQHGWCPRHAGGWGCTGTLWWQRRLWLWLILLNTNGTVREEVMCVSTHQVWTLLKLI